VFSPAPAPQSIARSDAHYVHVAKIAEERILAGVTAELTLELDDTDFGTLLLVPDFIDGPLSDMTPEIDSPMKIHFQTWSPQWLGPWCPWHVTQDFSFLVDWVWHTNQPISIDWDGVETIADSYRALEIERIDGISTVLVSGFEFGDAMMWSQHE